MKTNNVYTTIRDVARIVNGFFNVCFNNQTPEMGVCKMHDEVIVRSMGDASIYAEAHKDEMLITVLKNYKKINHSYSDKKLLYEVRKFLPCVEKVITKIENLPVIGGKDYIDLTAFSGETLKYNLNEVISNCEVNSSNGISEKDMWTIAMYRIFSHINNKMHYTSCGDCKKCHR